MMGMNMGYPMTIGIPINNPMMGMMGCNPMMMAIPQYNMDNNMMQQQTETPPGPFPMNNQIPNNMYQKPQNNNMYYYLPQYNNMYTQPQFNNMYPQPQYKNPQQSMNNSMNNIEN